MRGVKFKNPIKGIGMNKKKVRHVCRKLNVLLLHRDFARFHYENADANPRYVTADLETVLKDIMEMESHISPGDHFEWLKYAREDINLVYSIGDLYLIQKRAKTKAKKLTRAPVHTHQAARQMLMIRIERLEKILLDFWREIDHRKKVFYNHRPEVMYTNRNFWNLVNLDALLLALGIRDSASVRMYLDGVYSRRIWKKQFPHLATLASPLSVIDYLAFVRRAFLQRYANDPLAAKQRNYGLPYHEKMCGEALALAGDLILSAKHQKKGSRRYSEITGGIGPYPMFVYYMRTSMYIAKLWRNGKLRRIWPEAHSEYQALLKEGQGNMELTALLVKLCKRVDKLWDESGVPEARSGDKARLRRVFGKAWQ